MSNLEITVNGERRTLASPLTIDALLTELALRSNQVAVEVNMELIPRAQHSTQKIQPGDQLEIVTLAGGG